MSAEIGAAWLALIGATFGGAGLKFIEYYLSRGKAKDDTATVLRAELRTEVTQLRSELVRVETELDSWKGKYYDLLDQFFNLKKELKIPISSAKDNLTEAEKKVE
jgi:hypothetical protein